jgi:hypothetical protein
MSNAFCKKFLSMRPFLSFKCSAQKILVTIMKKTALFAVGLSLLLLNGSAANGQTRSPKPVAAYKKLSVYEGGGKISEINTLAKKETKSKPFAVHRKFPKYSGKWKGTLYQPDGTLRSKFRFMVRIYQ